MLQIKLNLSILSTLLFSLSIWAGLKEIRQVIKQYQEEGKLNGAILVAQSGTILCDTAVGWANKELKLKNTVETHFYGASITKTFTAVAIAQLVEQKKLTYQAPVKKYLPQLKGFANTITIHQLLTHTSGIPDYEVEMKSTTPTSNEVVLDWLNKEDRLNFEPGSQHKYCNSGFILLAKIIEKVSGISYETYLKERIFQPAQMQKTTLYKEITQKGKEVAIGYTKDGVLDDFEITTYGDTGLLTTTTDLYRYAYSLSHSAVLPIAQQVSMYTPVTLTNGKTANYGYGWRVVEQNKHKVVYHKGGLNGFKSILWRDLADDTIIVLLTNQGDCLPTDALVKDLYKAAQL